MNCRRIEELIPLYVEGDLGEHSASNVRSHLQSCDACRAQAAEYEASQAWLRAAEPPDFAETFVDTIRAGVMRELAASEATPPFVERLKMWLTPRRLAAATAALIVIFIALALFIYSSRSRVDQQDSRMANGKPASNVENDPNNQKAPPSDEPKTVHQPKRQTTYRRAPSLAIHSRRDVRRITTPQDNVVAQHPLNAIPAVPINDNAATYSKERLRIEFQTADPNIRIIWFAPKPMGGTL